MSKYKRITNFFISLSLIAGIVQQPISALNKTVPQSTPILNEKEAIEILNEQVDPEEYTAGEDAYGVYWETVPKNMFDSSLNNTSSTDSRLSVNVEGYGNIPLYKSIKDIDSGITLNLYLYGMFEFREYENKKSLVSPGSAIATNSYLFYTTLPYNNYPGFVDIVGFTSDGKPIPSTIFVPQMQRNYFSEDLLKNGGTANITDINGNTKEVTFQGMGDNWFNKGVGSQFETNWKSYGYKYPLASTNSLKNAMQSTPWSGYKTTEYGDPAAMVEITYGGTTYELVPRQVYSAIAINDTEHPTLATVGPPTFINDSGPVGDGSNLKKMGIYSPDNVHYLSWTSPLGKYADYAGSQNSIWMNENGKYNPAKILELQQITITEDIAENILQTYKDLDSQGKINWSEYNQNGNIYTIATLEQNLKDIVAGNRTLYKLPITENQELSEYGLIRNFDLTYGAHTLEDKVYYLSTGEGENRTYVAEHSGAGDGGFGNDFGWYNLLVNHTDPIGSYGHNFLDFHIDNKYFFNGPIQSNMIEELYNHGVPAEIARDWVDVNYTGKWLYFLNFFRVDGLMADPDKPINEKYDVSMSPSIAWTSNGKDPYEQLPATRGVHYNDTTLARWVDPVVELKATASLSRDLVVSGAQDDGLLKDDEYLKTNLYMVNPDISDSRFEQLVGKSKKDFKENLTTTMLDDKDIATGKNPDPYQGTNIGSLNKAEFLECFKIVDPLKDNLNKSDTYILQSAVYSTGSADNLEDYVDVKNAYYSSYHEEIYMGFSLDYLSDNLEPSSRKPIGELNDGEINHFPFSKSLYEHTNGTDLLGNALVKAASTGNPAAQKIATSGNRLQLLGITKDQGKEMATSTAVNFELYQPTGAEEGIQYGSSEKRDNIKIYRTIIHTPKKAETKDVKIKNIPSKQSKYKHI